VLVAFEPHAFIRGKYSTEPQYFDRPLTALLLVAARVDVFDFDLVGNEFARLAPELHDKCRKNQQTGDSRDHQYYKTGIDETMRTGTRRGRARAAGTRATRGRVLVSTRTIRAFAINLRKLYTIVFIHYVFLFNHAYDIIKTLRHHTRGIGMVTPTFAILDFSTPELIIILLIVLLLFGGKKLPELSRSLGTSMRELRKSVSDEHNDKSEKKQEKAKPESSAS